MATKKQRTAARKNIKKAQEKWKSMTGRQRAVSQPEGRKRSKPGTKGAGDFYRIEVRPKRQFATYRIQKLGRRGDVERLAGKRPSGSWDTQAWLIRKDAAHIERKKLVPDTKGAREVIERLGSEPKMLKADIFSAKPRPNVPEQAKPTPAQKRARRQNIRKARAARQKRK